jgi:hypothetical protein
MNTGMGDAVDLAWKLAATLAGWGGPGLLAAYEAERRPIGLRNAAPAGTYARRHLRICGRPPTEARAVRPDLHLAWRSNAAPTNPEGVAGLVTGWTSTGSRPGPSGARGRLE